MKLCYTCNKSCHINPVLASYNIYMKLLSDYLMMQDASRLFKLFNDARYQPIVLTVDSYKMTSIIVPVHYCVQNSITSQ
jgi:hypothetical protein